MRSIIPPHLSHLRDRLTAILALLHLVVLSASGQGEYDEWHFGDRHRLRFTGGAPALIPGGRIEALQGSASICSPSGDLLFYTNGVKVWNRNGAVMPSGDGLSGSISSTQAALIVPDPGDSLRYYIFTSDGVEYPLDPNGYYYSVVDMSRAGGLGDVSLKNVQLLTASSEHQTAVPHCNGRDFWVITHEGSGSSYLAYLVTRDGVSPAPVVSTLGTATRGYGPSAGWPTQGVLKASRNGDRLAASFGDGTSEVYDFDRATGRLSNAIKLTDKGNGYFHIGISFSPGGTKVYFSSRDVGLLQFSLESGNPAAIMGSRFLVSPDGGADLQLGPDDKLYRIGPTRISIIRKPDLAGAACDLLSDGLPAGGLGLPNNIDALHTELACGARAVIRASELEICQGGTVSLTGTSSVAETFEWSIPGGSPTTSRAPTLDVTFPTAGRHTVRLVVGASGVKDTAHIEIQVHPAPVVAAMPDLYTCPGQCVTFTPDVSGGLPGYTYVWAPAAGLSCIYCPNPVACPTVTTTYRVTVADARGCTTTAAVKVILEPCPPKADIADVVAPCLGIPIMFDGSASVAREWEWSFEGGAPAASSSPKESVVFTTPGIHRVRLIVRNDRGEADTTTKEIEVVPAPVVDAGPDTTICAEGCVDLSTSATGGAPPYSYAWEPFGGLSCLDCPAPRVCIAGTTTLRVAVTDARGCTVHDSVTVVVGCSAKARILFSGDTLCQYTGEGLFDGSTSTGRTCEWTFPGGTPSKSTDPKVSVTFAVPGTHTVTLIVRDGAVADTTMIAVVVGSKPRVTLDDDMTVCAGGCASLFSMVSGTGPFAYAWEPATGLSCTDCVMPVACPPASTTYRLTITDANGCTETDEITVTVTKCTPNARITLSDVSCQGGAITFDGSASDGNEWEWSFDGGTPATSRSAAVAVVFDTPGGHAVRLITRLAGNADTATMLIDVAGAPTVDAGPDRVVCPADCFTLEPAVRGGAPPYRYAWSSDAPIDCPDCMSPTVCADRSAIYRVTVTDARGCTATDEVAVTVLDPTVVRAHIPRGVTAEPGATIELPVMLDDQIGHLGLRSLTMAIAYDRAMLRPLSDDPSIGITTRGTLLDGWEMKDVVNLPGTFSATFAAPPGGGPVVGPGPLLKLRFSSFLAASEEKVVLLESDIPFEITSGLGCVTFDENPGGVRLEMCGLGLRLIEMLSAKYAITAVTPNPIRSSATIGFSIALDGPTTAEIFDASGTPVATLLREQLGAGSYTLHWEPGRLPSGAYYCRIRSGNWSDMVPLLVDR